MPWTVIMEKPNSLGGYMKDLCEGLMSTWMGMLEWIEDRGRRNGTERGTA